MMNLCKKLSVALVLLSPSAFLLSLDSYWIISSAVSAVAGSDFNFKSQTLPFLTMFLVGWAVPLFWVMATDSIRRTIGRTCWVFSIAGFMVPVAGLVSTLLAYLYQSDLDSRWFAVFIQIMVGIPIGTIGLVLALNVSPQGSSESLSGMPEGHIQPING